MCECRGEDIENGDECLQFDFLEKFKNLNPMDIEARSVLK